ncbi:MAG: DUF5684 domain-containing protein [Acidobacteriota bacterium]|jgi:hypothetical protein
MHDYSTLNYLIGGGACSVWFFLYLYLSLCLHVIGNKTGVPNAWLAWIPIINLWVVVRAGDKGLWWIIMFFIPLINIIFGVLIWVAIAERRGKPGWIGILTIIPVVNILIPGYLAFSE